jgi:hypothetical protein
MAPSFCHDHRRLCGPHTVFQMKACSLCCCSVLRRGVIGGPSISVFGSLELSGSH